MSMNDKDQQFAAFMQVAAPLLREAFNSGYATGFRDGQILGYVEGVNALTPAVSDGLRHGSPECGKAMQGLKNLGLDTESGGHNDRE